MGGALIKRLHCPITAEETLAPNDIISARLQQRSYLGSFGRILVQREEVKKCRPSLLFPSSVGPYEREMSRLHPHVRCEVR